MLRIEQNSFLANRTIAKKIRFEEPTSFRPLIQDGRPCGGFIEIIRITISSTLFFIFLEGFQDFVEGIFARSLILIFRGEEIKSTSPFEFINISSSLTTRTTPYACHAIFDKRKKNPRFYERLL